MAKRKNKHPFNQERIDYAKQHKIAERQLLPIFRRALYQSIDPVINWANTFGLDGLNPDTLINRNVWSQTYQRAFNEIGVKFARREYYFQRKQEGLAEEEEKALGIGFLIDVWIGKLKDFASSYAAQISPELNDYTVELIRKALGEAGSLEIDALGRVRWFISTIKNAMKGRSLNISRTEATRTSNLGKELGARSWIEEQSGTGYKMWLGREDERERESHNKVNNTIIPIDDYYTVGGELALRPGDTALSAKETINCFLPDQITSQDKRAIKKVIRSFYNGKTVTVHTSAGKNFTCTPNHPILTSVGWVNAGELNDSHKLIHSSSINVGFFTKFNINSVKISFKEAFDSLNKVGFSMRVRGAVVNLYGRIPTQDVDIVRAKRSLWNTFKSIDFYIFKSFSLIAANFRKCFGFCYGLFSGVFFMKFRRHASYFGVSLFSKPYSFLGSCLAHSNVHRFAPISDGNPIVSDYAMDCASNGIITNSKSFDAFSVLMPFTNFISKVIKLRFNVLMAGNSSSRENPSDTIERNKRFFFDLWHSKPCLSETDDVVGVEWGEFSGHVYSFETVNQIYDINSYIASNCRCSQSLMSENRRNQLEKRGRIIGGKVV